MSSTSVYPEVCIRMAMPNNSRIQFMLDQEDDPDLDETLLAYNERLTCFRTSI